MSKNQHQRPQRRRPLSVPLTVSHADGCKRILGVTALVPSTPAWPVAGRYTVFSFWILLSVPSPRNSAAPTGQLMCAAVIDAAEISVRKIHEKLS